MFILERKGPMPKPWILHFGETLGRAKTVAFVVLEFFSHPRKHVIHTLRGLQRTQPGSTLTLM